MAEVNLPVLKIEVDTAQLDETTKKVENLNKLPRETASLIYALGANIELMGLDAFLENPCSRTIKYSPSDLQFLKDIKYQRPVPTEGIHEELRGLTNTEILRQQLELLAKQSQTADVTELINISMAIIEISKAIDFAEEEELFI